MGRKEEDIRQDLARRRHRLYGNRQRDERTLPELSKTMREDGTISSSAPNLPTTEDIDNGSASTKLISKRSVRTVPVDSLWSLLPRTRRGSPAKDIDDLPTISDQLLNYVARPTHKKMTLTVKFSRLMKRYTSKTRSSSPASQSWVCR
jgi:chorismate synthase